MIRRQEHAHWQIYSLKRLFSAHTPHSTAVWKSLQMSSPRLQGPAVIACSFSPETHKFAF